MVDDIVSGSYAWIHQYGYVAVFVLLMFGIVGLPIPDETLLVFTGYLSFTGELSLPFALLAAGLGSACGITLSYTIGRVLGPRARTTLGPWFHLTEERVHATQQWVDRWGRYALLITYFVPGLRHLGAIVVGASGLRYSVFATFAYAGACLWSGTFIMLGYLLGEEWGNVSDLLHHTFRGMTVGVVFLVGLVLVVLYRRPTRPT